MKKQSILKIFTIFLPLTAVIGSVVLVLFFLISPASFSDPEILKFDLSDGRFKSGEEIAFFNNQKVIPPDKPLPESQFLAKRRKVLSATDEEKWIEINLAEQKLYAHQGDKIAHQFLISSGKWGRTPTGEFRIWSKLKYTLMSGGSTAINTYYYLPNVPFTQYFNGDYGIHGTYWHNNFGHPMSHGCINMNTLDAQTLFSWTNPSLPEDKWIAYPTSSSPGTKVVVHGNAPYE